MEKSAVDYQEEIRFIGLALWGCGLLTLGSLLRIPLYPVPFTLQTLALFILALTQSPKQVLGSTLSYLLCASIGLPVLGGKINFLWMAGPSGGYLLAFPVAAYAIAYLHQKWPAIAALLCGQAVIFTIGGLWLVPFLGIQAALIKGVLIFIPSGFCKIFAALSFVKWKNR